MSVNIKLTSLNTKINPDHHKSVGFHSIASQDLSWLGSNHRANPYYSFCFRDMLCDLAPFSVRFFF